MKKILNVLVEPVKAENSSFKHKRERDTEDCMSEPDEDVSRLNSSNENGEHEKKKKRKRNISSGHETSIQETDLEASFTELVTDADVNNQLSSQTQETFDNKKKKKRKKRKRRENKSDSQIADSSNVEDSANNETNFESDVSFGVSDSQMCLIEKIIDHLEDIVQSQNNVEGDDIQPSSEIEENNRVCKKKKHGKRRNSTELIEKSNDHLEDGVQSQNNVEGDDIQPSSEIEENNSVCKKKKHGKRRNSTELIEKSNDHLEDGVQSQNNVEGDDIQPSSEIEENNSVCKKKKHGKRRNSTELIEKSNDHLEDGVQSQNNVEGDDIQPSSEIEENNSVFKKKKHGKPRNSTESSNEIMLGEISDKKKDITVESEETNLVQKKHKKKSVHKKNLSEDVENGDAVDVKLEPAEVEEAEIKSETPITPETPKQGKRLCEFKSYNTMSCSKWKEISKDLLVQGKKFDTGRFTVAENKQLEKNWKKIVKKCPFDEPFVLLRNKMAPELEKDIKEFIQQNDFYIKLGANINRPLYSVYNRARKIFKPAQSKGDFTPKEIEQVIELEREYGNKWEKIGQVIGRPGQAVCDKFKKIKRDLVVGPWDEDETRKLRDAILEEIGSCENAKDYYYNLPWTKIAKKIPTRNAKQCRQRWLEYEALQDPDTTKRYRFFSKPRQAQLIKEVISLNVNDESVIDWFDLMKKFEDIPSPQYLQGKWHKIKCMVPDYHMLKFHEILDILEDDILPKLEEEIRRNVKTGDL